MIEVPPSQASFCTEVITGTTFCPLHGTRCRREECQRKYGTDTDYFHLYTADRPLRREIGAGRPGWYKISSTTRLTPQGRQRNPRVVSGEVS